MDQHGRPQRPGPMKPDGLLEKSAAQMSRTATQALFTAALLTGFSMLLHFTSPSTIHLDNPYWTTLVEHHQTFPPFAVRPLTTNVIELLHDGTGLTHRAAFFLLQFALMLISGLVFFRFVSALRFTARESLGGMCLYMAAMPVMLAHFEPMWTWSDFWIYLLVPLAFWQTVHRRFWLAAVALALATLERETTILFYPAWAVLIASSARGRRQALLWPAVALIMMLAARFAISGAHGGEPQVELAFNFDGPQRTRDTIFALTGSLGVLWLTGPAGLTRLDSGPVRVFLLIGSLVTVAGYTSSTLLLGRAREMRLFFPPFVFLIPLTLCFLRGVYPAVSACLREHRLRLAVVSIVCLSLGMLCSWQLFPEFEYRRWQDGFRFFWGVNAGAALWLGVILLRSRMTVPRPTGETDHTTGH